ncbi:hypothetical protein DFJ74DRAFT_268650 [Hyaloraphidium curvatum]|nr:hypothetical protein DFJ74DRAFT_268650 [Hyaloraphidium curvatum]
MHRTLFAPYDAWTGGERAGTKAAVIGRWLLKLRELVTLHASEAQRIERVIEVLRQVEAVPSVRTIQSGRAPSVNYVSDMFHGHEVHNLLRTLDPAKLLASDGPVSLEAVSSFIRKRTEQGSPPPDQAQTESLFFVLQYLKSYGGDGLPDKMPATANLPEFWRLSFEGRTLRFLGCSDEGGRTLPMNVMLNEWLEHVRLAWLFKSPDWTRITSQLAQNVQLPDDDLRKLAVWIQSSILTVEDFVDSSTWMVIAIPIWSFSPNSLRTSLFYKAGVEAGASAPLSHEWLRIGSSTTTLLAAYVRKAERTEGFVQEALDFLMSLAKLTNTAVDQREMILPIVESLCSTAGRSPAEDEERNAERIAQLVALSRKTESVIVPEAGAAAVAHFLVACSNVAAVERLCRGLVLVGEKDPAVGLDEGVRLCQLFQVALFNRLGPKGGEIQKTGFLSRLSRFFRSDKPAALDLFEADALVGSVETVGSEPLNSMRASCYAATGLFWACASHLAGETGASGGHDIHRRSEALAWRLLAALASRPAPDGEKGLEQASLQHGSEASQRAVLYCANKCLASSPDFGIRVAQPFEALPDILQMCMAAILEDEDALGLGSGFFAAVARDHRDFLASVSADKVFSSSETHQKLNRKAGTGPRPVLYAEVGRISRSIGLLMARCWASGQHDSVLRAVERLRVFACGLCESWAGCPFSRSETQGAQAFEQTSTLFWEYFKTVLFSVVSMTRTLVGDEIASPRRAGSASATVMAADATTARTFVSILETFRDLHFVASRLGSEGFGPWREVIVDIADWFADRAAETSSSRGEASAEDWGIQHSARALFGGIISALDDNVVRKSQELFCLLYARQTLPVLEEPLVAADVLPRMQRYTASPPAEAAFLPEDLDLFEVSHGIARLLFEHAARFRRTTATFAPKYVAQLFDVSSGRHRVFVVEVTGLAFQGYPTRIDLDLLRQSYTAVIRGLSFGVSVAAGEDIDITQSDARSSAEEDAPEEVPPDETGEAAEMDAAQTDVVRLCLERLYGEVDRRTSAIRAMKEGTGANAEDWEEARRKDAEFLLQIIEAVRNGAFAPADRASDDGNAWSKFLRLPKSDPTRIVAERGQLMVVLIDQIRSVTLELLPEVLDVIRDEMLQTDVLEGEGSPLWNFVFNAISSSRAFDATKKRYCVDWYLSLVKDRKEQLRARRRNQVAEDTATEQPPADDTVVKELPAPRL